MTDFEKVYIGIDPGLDGAICYFRTDIPSQFVADMPTLEIERGGKKKREIDEGRLAEMLTRVRDNAKLFSEPAHVVCEAVNAMPEQGVTSTFAFGKGYGIIRGILAALEIPRTYVPPVTWKRALQLSSDKDASRRRAGELMPQAAKHWPLKKHDGRAEAALLAYYGRKLGL